MLGNLFMIRRRGAEPQRILWLIQSAAEPRTRNRVPGTGTGTGTSWRTALLVLAGALVYVNSLSAPFIFDDEIAVVANPAIRSLTGAWSQPRNTPLAGRPVAGFTFALNFAANDVDAATYRATNIAIHIACALLVFGLVRRTLALPRLAPRFGRIASDLAFAIALLWVVHPLTTDAVTYISQRTESLMALCYLLTLYASLRSHDRRSTLDDRRSTMDDRRWTIADRRSTMDDGRSTIDDGRSTIDDGRSTIDDPVAGRGGCRVRAGHGREGIHGHRAADGRVLRSRLPVRSVPSGARRAQALPASEPESAYGPICADQLKEAFVEAEHALAVNPTNADAHHLMGKLLALQGRLKESIVSFETAVKLRPDDVVIREDLARVQRLR